ncbi:hypothetical protein [Streptosporangium sp. NPDC000509]|uniref:hypothetical protein n=1 Tax=Streptosporangium sp. NPDC000509 TaxID=3366186 RepID=UPI0036B3B1B7
MTTTAYRSRYPLLAASAGERPLADVELTVTLEVPTFHGHTELTVRPGVVDDAAIELYGYGECAVLARAMHLRTGWPLALVETVERIYRWAHVGVLTPAGHLLDIHGNRSLQQVQADFKREHGLRVTTCPLPTLNLLFDVIGEREETRRGWIDGSAIAPLTAELAGVFADLLIAQAQADEISEAVSC